MDLNLVRILIVDDHPKMVEILRSVLSGLGASGVDQAGSAEAARKRLRDTAFDLVIVDQSLGGESGLDLVRSLRRHPQSPAPFVPVLMLTADGAKKTVAAARDAGVNEFLIKPVTPAALFQRLEAMIFRPRPFIRSSNYCGPDRRRRASPDYAGPERRSGG